MNRGALTISLAVMLSGCVTFAGEPWPEPQPWGPTELQVVGVNEGFWSARVTNLTVGPDAIEVTVNDVPFPTHEGCGNLRTGGDAAFCSDREIDTDARPSLWRASYNRNGTVTIALVEPNDSIRVTIANESFGPYSFSGPPPSATADNVGGVGIKIKVDGITNRPVDAASFKLNGAAIPIKVGASCSELWTNAPRTVAVCPKYDSTPLSSLKERLGGERFYHVVGVTWRDIVEVEVNGSTILKAGLNRNALNFISPTGDGPSPAFAFSPYGYVLLNESAFRVDGAPVNILSEGGCPQNPDKGDLAVCTWGGRLIKPGEPLTISTVHVGANSGSIVTLHESGVLVGALRIDRGIIYLHQILVNESIATTGFHLPHQREEQPLIGIAIDGQPYAVRWDCDAPPTVHTVYLCASVGHNVSARFVGSDSAHIAVSLGGLTVAETRP